MRGSSGCIRNASVVIIEADYCSLAQCAKVMYEYGFMLIDIVDRVMYGEVLWHCHLVYLRDDLMNENLRPPMFERRLWHLLP
jgi:hypothetical protein